MHRRLNQIKRGIVTGLPIFLGYFPIAVAFGIIAKTTGLDLAASAAFSVFVFAGASQFIALNMLALGMKTAEITIAVFLINLRHFLMSASLAARIEQKTPLLPVAAFGVTDETFAAASSLPERNNEGLTPLFMTALNFTAYLGWVTGTVAGYLSGNLLPEKLQTSLGILLYVMFVGLLVPAAVKNREALITALTAGLINSLLVYYTELNSGWCIVISIILSSLLTMACLSFPLLSGEKKVIHLADKEEK